MDEQKELIYVDGQMHCHRTGDDTMQTVETDFFIGKCDAFLEGYCCDVQGGSIWPWKPYSELDAAQREYEKQLIAEYEAALAEIEAALGV